jgi:hypothetical protein
VINKLLSKSNTIVQGTFIGGPVCTALNARLGDKFTCQGIGAPGYPALFLDNIKTGGTCKTCVETAVKTFQDVSAKCPNAKIAFLGYRLVVPVYS